MQSDAAARQYPSGVTAGWIHEEPPSPEAVYIDVDGYLWLCVSHWGPVHNTGVLAPPAPF